MENLSGNGGCCLSFHPSSTFISETNTAAAHSIRSSRYSYSSFSRTESEFSALSETVDDSICSEEVSPKFWELRSDVLRHAEENNKSYVHHDHQDPESVFEIMEERFSKLLLGEDMSGSGKGVCSAITISNAITNLYATIFSQNLKLQPLPPKKKNKWKVEMECLLSISDYILEFFPQTQKLADGTLIEVMSSRRRSDIYMSLPALKKLDEMLLEILESFKESEFWYVEKEKTPTRSNRVGSFRMEGGMKEEKWWLPMPCVPPGGLSEESKNHLKNKRESAKQMLKAAMAINTTTLSEISIPPTYLSSLPKCGRTSLGEFIHRHLSTSSRFSPEHLLSQLDIKSEHEALGIADRVEASVYIWRRKACTSQQRTSWVAVRDVPNGGDSRGKNQVMAERAERLLHCLKLKYPQLPQTTLDMCKIQYNRDVGQGILESYSRVLESLAFNIVGWIEDVIREDMKI